MYTYVYKRLYFEQGECYADSYPNFNLYELVSQNFSTLIDLHYRDKYIEISFSKRLTNDENRLLDDIVTNLKIKFEHNLLNLLKDELISKIRLENQVILLKYGFEYPVGSGIRYAVTDAYTSTWNGMLLAKDKLEYPQKIRDIYNKLHYLNSPDEVMLFWGTGSYYKSWVFRTTSDFILAIKSFTTVSEINNFNDYRLNFIPEDFYAIMDTIPE